MENFLDLGTTKGTLILIGKKFWKKFSRQTVRAYFKKTGAFPL
jgi:hypothetical protein